MVTAMMHCRRLFPARMRPIRVKHITLDLRPISACWQLSGTDEAGFDADIVLLVVVLRLKVLCLLRTEAIYA